MKSTIAAISTPIGSGAIGIVRMSGKESLDILNKVFVPTRKSAIPFQSHKIHHGHIRNPKNNRIIDEVLVSYMGAPYSFTTEDTVEINSHSNQLILERILELLIDMGARLARPGEFTQRAFLGGRIDLTQAEAVAEVIRAGNEKALEIGQSQLEGSLGKKIKDIYDALVNILTQLEIEIDFPDHGAEVDRQEIIENLSTMIRKPVESLIKNFQEGSIFRHGIKVVIIGKTNVGKSSLLNSLTGDNTVIVTETPGTTRDTITSQICIQGIPIQLTDTAGIRETEDSIENMGIERAKEALRKAHIVLNVTDIENRKFDDEIQKLIGLKKPILWVINKVDLAKDMTTVLNQDHPRKTHLVSAKHGWGMDELKRSLVQEIFGKTLEQQSVINAPNLRQKECLVKSLDHIKRAHKQMKSGAEVMIVAEDVKEAALQMQRILGTNLENDLVEAIFKDFCVGK